MILLVCGSFSFAANLVNIEDVAKAHNAVFHWYPVQKSVMLTTAKDTIRFAEGIAFASWGKQSFELSQAPMMKDGIIWIADADVQKIFAKPAAVATPTSSAATAPKTSAPISSSSIAALPPASSATAAVAPQSSAAVSAPASSATPVVSPVAAPKNETAGTREVKTIVIDPGHGGKDSGALGKKAQEKDIVLAVAKLLKKELEKEGFNVKLTRDKDVFIELGQRANLANKWDGDLFLSLHCNAIDATPERKKQVQGYHFYVLRAPESEEDRAIARRENKVAALYGEKNAKEELTPIEWFKLEARLEKYKQNSYMITEQLLNSFNGGHIRKLSGGVGGAGFMVLVGAMMPAVLIELGFISNPEDEEYMMTAKGQQDLAERVSKAVARYKEAVHSYRETLGR
ncbi:MAG: N-acetylmuramoyl-L-alanine amidase [Fibrobacter sp.]|nr:N-acetylmuramoyl-L-alanine amidase [Fibrobacter sp.]